MASLYLTFIKLSKLRSSLKILFGFPLLEIYTYIPLKQKYTSHKEIQYISVFKTSLLLI